MCFICVMKNILATFCITAVVMGLITCFSQSAQASTNSDRAFLKEQGQIYANAYMKRDYETCYKMMGGSIVKAVGGKINALNNLQKTENELKRHGLVLQNISVDIPREIIPHNGDLYAIIPEKQFYMVNNHELILESYLLAVSSDNGKRWSLMEGSAKLADHLRIKQLMLFSCLKIPTRVLYLVENKKFRMIEKGGSFVTNSETRKYIKSLRKR